MSITAWGFLTAWKAFFVMNFFHGLQYFALVWRTENGNTATPDPARARAGRWPLLFVAFAAITLLAGSCSSSTAGLHRAPLGGGAGTRRLADALLVRRLRVVGPQARGVVARPARRRGRRVGRRAPSDRLFGIDGRSLAAFRIALGALVVADLVDARRGHRGALHRRRRAPARGVSRGCSR